MYFCHSKWARGLHRSTNRFTRKFLRRNENYTTTELVKMPYVRVVEFPNLKKKIRSRDVNIDCRLNVNQPCQVKTRQIVKRLRRSKPKIKYVFYLPRQLFRLRAPD